MSATEMKAGAHMPHMSLSSCLLAWPAAVQRALLGLWRRPALRTAIGLWAATRALMIGLTVFGVLFTSSNSGIATYHPSFTFGDFVDHWWIWDTGWYVGISQQGYPFFTNP